MVRDLLNHQRLHLPLESHQTQDYQEDQADQFYHWDQVDHDFPMVILR